VPGAPWDSHGICLPLLEKRTHPLHAWGGTQNTPLGGPWGGGVHEERPLRARAVFQVVSRPFAQDLAEPVEALVPDGGDKVEGGAEVVSVLASSRWVRLAP